MNIIGCTDPLSREMFINGTLCMRPIVSILPGCSRYLGFICQRLILYLTAEENITIPALYISMPEGGKARQTHADPGA